MKIHELIWPEDHIDHIARHGVSRCSGCVTGHPSPPDAFALATMIAFGGPSRPASTAAHPYAVHHSSHNDLTPLRGYRGLIGFASLSMPPRLIEVFLDWKPSD